MLINITKTHLWRYILQLSELNEKVLVLYIKHLMLLLEVVDALESPVWIALNRSNQIISCIKIDSVLLVYLHGLRAPIPREIKELDDGSQPLRAPPQFFLPNHQIRVESSKFLIVSLVPRIGEVNACRQIGCNCAVSPRDAGIVELEAFFRHRNALDPGASEELIPKEDDTD